MIRHTMAWLLAVAMLAPTSLLTAADHSGRRVHVRGYYRKDGTYVRPHTRSWPDSKSADSVPRPFIAPSTRAPQRPVMYYNPFLHEPAEPPRHGVTSADSAVLTKSVPDSRTTSDRSITDYGRQRRPESELSERTSAGADESKWHKVATINGNGTKSTETFGIADREWRVSWDTKGNAVFAIYVYADDGKLKEVIAGVVGDSHDSSIVRGAGKYYLTIVSGQVYEITVETKR